MMWRVAYLMAVLAGAASGPALASVDRCAAEVGLAGTPAPLSHTAPLIRAGSTLDVLVIGSATVFGPEASLQPGTITGRLLGVPEGVAPGHIAASDHAFPTVMARAIEAAVPGVTVRVTIRGARGIAATDMLELMRTEMKAHHYPLVIWQTGTVEAVRNVQPGDFAQTLADGEQLVHESDADLILIDPQYSRFLQTNANLDPYLQAFQQAAAMPDVLWFKRYDLMRSWVADGKIDLERTARAERKPTVEALHACLGAQLAHLVLDSLRS